MHKRKYYFHEGEFGSRITFTYANSSCIFSFVGVISFPMNSLQKYLDQHSMTITAFSRVSKLPIPTIWRYVNGKFRPSATNALRIEEATGGAVTRMELLYPEQKNGGR